MSSIGESPKKIAPEQVEILNAGTQSPRKEADPAAFAQNVFRHSRAAIFNRGFKSGSVGGPLAALLIVPIAVVMIPLVIVLFMVISVFAMVFGKSFFKIVKIRL